MKDHQRLWQRKEVCLAYAYTLLLSVVLFVPVPQSTGIPQDAHIDKYIHMFLFAIFTFIWIRALWRGMRVPLVFLLIPFSYALFTEVVQGFLPYRNGDYFDFIFDMAGALLAYIIVRLIPLKSPFIIKK